MTADRQPSRPTVPAWMLPPEPARPAPRRRSAVRTVALAATAGLLAGAVGGAVGGDAPVPATPAPAATAAGFSGESVSAIAARVLPSVVSLDVRSRSGAGSGSGVVLDDEGHVLTNNHVVEPGVAGSVTVVLSDGRRADAEVVGRDPVTDLAVVDVDVPGLRPIELGRSRDAQVGDAVVAVGSPLGLAGTVTTGIVSGLGRTVRTSPDAPLFGALQTDAAINPGNSGGALVDAEGRLIGINTAISTQGGGGSIGLGFAIPVDQARSIADQLIRTGRATHPSLGVGATTVGATDDSPSGAQLAEVPAESAAAGAGLRAGDLVTAVEDRPVTGVDDLVIALRNYDVGERVRISYSRAGEQRNATLVLDERDS